MTPYMWRGVRREISELPVVEGRVKGTGAGRRKRSGQNR